MEKEVMRPTDGIRLVSLLRKEESESRLSSVERFEESIRNKIRKARESNCEASSLKSTINFYRLFQEMDTVEEAVIHRVEEKPVTKYITEGLQNDLRVKWHRRMNGDIFVKFWSITDAVSFYRQHSWMASMEFIDFSVWEEKVAEAFVRNSRDAGARQSKKRKMSLEMTKKEIKSYKIHKEEFLERISFFDNKKNYYTKEEVDAMEERFLSGDAEFIYHKPKEIACGYLSNVILQKAVKSLSSSQLYMLVEKLGEDIGPLGATKHGAYSIQAIIDSAKEVEVQYLISENIKKYGQFMFSHSIGNYAIQKVLVFDPETVYQLLISNFREVIEDSIGIKVLKRCITAFEGKKVELLKLLEAIESPINRRSCDAIRDILESIN